MSRDLILLIVLPFIFDTIEDWTSVYYEVYIMIKPWLLDFPPFKASRFVFRQVLSDKKKIGGWGGKGMEAVGIYPPPSPPAVDGKQRVENGRSAWHTT